MSSNKTAKAIQWIWKRIGDVYQTKDILTLLLWIGVPLTTVAAVVIGIWRFFVTSPVVATLALVTMTVCVALWIVVAVLQILKHWPNRKAQESPDDERPQVRITYKPSVDRMPRASGKSVDVAVRIKNQTKLPTKVKVQVVRVQAVGDDKVHRQPAFEKIKESWVTCIPRDQIDTVCADQRPLPFEFELAGEDEKQIVIASASPDSFELLTTIGEWFTHGIDEDEKQFWRFTQYVQLNGEWRIHLKAYANNESFDEAKLSIRPDKSKGMPEISFRHR